MTLEYAPAETVPVLPPRPSDHPEYGTCPGCVQAKRLLKGGWLPDHNTGELPYGSTGKARFHCPFSGRRYAEFGEFAKSWSPRLADWEFLSVPVPVLIVSVPESMRPDTELPLWENLGVTATDRARHVANQLQEGDRWRIELNLSDAAVTAWLIQLDDGIPTGVFRHEEPRAMMDAEIAVTRAMEQVKNRGH